MTEETKLAMPELPTDDPAELAQARMYMQWGYGLLQSAIAIGDAARIMGPNLLPWLDQDSLFPICRERLQAIYFAQGATEYLKRGRCPKAALSAAELAGNYMEALKHDVDAMSDRLYDTRVNLREEMRQSSPSMTFVVMAGGEDPPQDPPQDPTDK